MPTDVRGAVLRSPGCEPAPVAERYRPRRREMRRDFVKIPACLSNLPKWKVPLALAFYSTLALRWYPARIGSRWFTQEPLRLARFGFIEEWPRCDAPAGVCTRPVWGLLLLPIVLFVCFLFYRYGTPPLLTFLKSTLSKAVVFERRFPCIAFRCFFLAAFLSMIYVPVNRAVGHTFPTWSLHEATEFALFPMAVTLSLAYIACVVVVRLLGCYVNPFLMPTRHTPLRHHLSLRYQYDGLAPEIARFLLLLLVTVILVGLISPLVKRFPRVWSAIAVCSCLLWIAAFVFVLWP